MYMILLYTSHSSDILQQTRKVNTRKLNNNSDYTFFLSHRPSIHSLIINQIINVYYTQNISMYKFVSSCLVCGPFESRVHFTVLACFILYCTDDF